MSDAVLAKDLVGRIGNKERLNVGHMLDTAYAAILRHLPKEQAEGWTRRRVRALWGKEAARVEYHEMMELAAVAKAAEAERKALQDARNEHSNFIAETARLEAFLTAQDAAFHSHEIEARRSVVRGMDRAGTQTEGTEP